MPDDPGFSSRRWSVSGSWLPWLAAGAVLAALVYFHIAQAAYPVFYSESQSTHFTWKAGWPFPSARLTSSGGFNVQPLALVANLAFAALLVMGSFVAVRRWTRGLTIPLPAAGPALAALAVTLLVWGAILLTQPIPIPVFLGWAALVVVFLAVPCAAYALANRESRISLTPRFSLRALLVVVTLICIFAAVFAWRQNAIRAARRAQVPVVSLVWADYGVMKAVDAHASGRRFARNYRNIHQTTAIPCRLGTVFGVEYLLAIHQPASNQGTFQPDVVNLKLVWHYPAQITDPKRGTSERESKRTMGVRAGQRHVEVFWLGSEPYLVPGPWKLEIWQDTGIPSEDRKLLEQVFVVGEE